MAHLIQKGAISNIRIQFTDVANKWAFLVVIIKVVRTNTFLGKFSIFL